MTLNVERLRQLALGQLVHQFASLSEAMPNIKFVQYDPIRKPLRAQDLILLQRVKDYKPGDLDNYYPGSALEEDCLHVYGVLPKEFADLLRPRAVRKETDIVYRPKGLSADVLSLVSEQGEVGARDIANVLGRAQVTNDWGGKSVATTRMLEELHHHGFVRIAKRINGNKIYALASSNSHNYSPEERLGLLTQLLVEILTPVSELGLRRAIGQLSAASGGLKGLNVVVSTLLDSGKIEYQTIDDVRYYMPTDSSTRKQEDAQHNSVRFLSPFDPIVWDRDRFEHLWGWRYRFEAYIPPHARQFGYYALPMFFGNKAIGWVNMTNNSKGQLCIERGFANKKITDHDFERAYEQEVNRFKSILSY
jgi:uncharacterized protein YcaQ